MIVVGTTLAAFVMDQPDTWEAWLRNAEALIASHPEGVQYFAALEIDARGLEPFQPLLARFSEINGMFWEFNLNDGRTEVTTQNRLRHITMGQNLVTDFCCSNHEVSHLLFMAADCMPPDDVLPRLLELNHPITAPYITTYGLRGEVVPQYPAEWGVEDAMASAAAIMIDRNVFRTIRWRWDLDAGLSDDPCFYRDTHVYLGIPTYVRHDIIARHFPEAIGPVETRGHDMTVAR